MKETTGRRLQKYAALLGISQTELREKLDFPKSTMSSYWNDLRAPKQNIISYISEKLNVNEAWLLGYDVQMEKTPVADNEIVKELHMIIESNKNDESFMRKLLEYSSFLISQKKGN